MKQPTIVVACSICDETGILLGAAGVGIVCAQCTGNGFFEYGYKPFTGQKKRAGIKRVRRSGQGILFAGEQSADAGISYDDFLKGKRP